jgi:hypothetical protein
VQFHIRNRWSGEIQFSCELTADLESASYGLQLGFAVRKAIEIGANLSEANLSEANLSEANLSEANLRGADLSAADLSAADLSEANLRGANLSEANLSEANLSAADLSEANLSEANLSEANLRGANLRAADLSAANLSEANLRGANLSVIRDDLWAVLSAAPREVEGLRAALIEGRVNGSAYSGSCACLVGTLANVRGVDYHSMGVLRPNASRPIERFFLSINQGDKPDANQHSALVVQWIDEWLFAMRGAFGPKEVA